MALTDDLRISLPFNGDFLDKSGNGNNVTPSGITLETADPAIGSGNANGDGFSDGEIADSPSLDANFITVASVVKYTTSATLITYDRSNGTQGPNNWLGAVSGGTLGAGIHLAGSNRSIFTPLSYNNGNWHLFLWMYDGAFLRLFVDNVYVAELAAAHGPIGASSDPITVFARKGKVLPFAGDQDSFLMWGRAVGFGGISIGQQATGEVAEVWNGGAFLEIDLTAANGYPFFFDAGHY